MALAEEIMALAPGSLELEGIRSRAVAGDPNALQRYGWWCFWRATWKTKGVSRGTRIKNFQKLVASVNLKVTLDG